MAHVDQKDLLASKHMQLVLGILFFFFVTICDLFLILSWKMDHLFCGLQLDWSIISFGYGHGSLFVTVTHASLGCQLWANDTALCSRVSKIFVGVTWTGKLLLSFNLCACEFSCGLPHLREKSFSTVYLYVLVLRMGDGLVMVICVISRLIRLS